MRKHWTKNNIIPQWQTTTSPSEYSRKTQSDIYILYIYGQNFARSPFSSFALMNMQIWPFPTEHAQNWADKMQLDSLAPWFIRAGSDCGRSFLHHHLAPLDGGHSFCTRRWSHAGQPRERAESKPLDSWILKVYFLSLIAREHFRS